MLILAATHNSKHSKYNVYVCIYNNVYAYIYIYVCTCKPVEPPKAVAEVSKIGNYRRGWSVGVWITE